MEKKKWYLSRSVWVGVVGLIGGILQATGIIAVPITPETVAIILGVIVVILRMITKEPIEW
jgi:hypothetical protein